MLICRDFMDADMNRTKLIISYLRPLLRLESPQLEHFIHKSVLHTACLLSIPEVMYMYYFIQV